MDSLTGPPGCGKSTQIKLLQDQGFITVAAGDLLRRWASADIIKKMSQGQMADNDYTNSLIGRALDEFFAKPSAKIILDGYPRIDSQADWLIRTYPGKFKTCLLLTAPFECLTQRLLDRGRVDDKIEVIRTRFELHQQNIKPLLAYYRNQGIKVITINADQSIQAVAADIKKILELA